MRKLLKEVQSILNGGMVITIEDGGAVTFGRTIAAVVKAGVGVGVDVPAGSRWRLIEEGELTLKTRCLPFMLLILKAPH